MKFIIATPIYPPEIGGPAIHAQNLKEGLKKKGHSIKIVSYSYLKKYPQPLRIILYSLKLFKNAKGYDLIYAFNLTSCGLPVYLASKFFKKKFLVRIGGDFLWERAVETGRTKKSLREYYEVPKTLKERFWIWLIRRVLNKADKIIFTSTFQKDIYLTPFKIKEKKVIIIQHPFPYLNFKTTLADKFSNNYQLLYAGRLLKLKNLDFLINSFYTVLSKTNRNLTLKIIGQGPERESLEFKIKSLGLGDKAFIKNPLTQPSLLKEIQQSYLCILPSLTEITPNFALECIKLQKPILLTKEVSYYRTFKDKLIFIDPKNEKDLEKKIIHLLDKDNYSNYIERIKKINTNRSWEDVIEEYEKSFIY